MMFRSVPDVQRAREQVVGDPAELPDHGKSEDPRLPSLPGRVLPDGEESVEADMNPTVLVLDVQSLAHELEVGADLGNQVVALVHVLPLDFAAAAFYFLSFDAGLADRARRVVVDLHVIQACTIRITKPVTRALKHDHPRIRTPADEAQHPDRRIPGAHPARQAGS